MGWLQFQSYSYVAPYHVDTKLELHTLQFRLHTALHFGVKAKENQDKVPTLYWLPKLHKKPYKARFIANSSSCTTTELSKLLTSCLTAVKKHGIKYCEKVYERSGKNLFWSIKNSGEILDKLKARDFNATSLSTYDFSTLYYGGLFVPFRYFVLSSFRRRYGAAPRRNNAKRKDEITKKRPNEITKRRNNARRKDEKTKCAKRNDEKRARKDEKTPCEITPF